MKKSDIEITNKQIKSIFKNFNKNLNIIDIQSIKEGLLNPVFDIIFSNNQNLILRIVTPTKYKQKVIKESIIYNLMQKLKIPSPKVLYTDTSKEIIPFDYSISVKLSGSAFGSNYNNYNFDELIAIYKELGKYVAQLHSIKFNQFGSIQKTNDKLSVGSVHELLCCNNNIGPFNSWFEMFGEVIKEATNKLKYTPFKNVLPQIQNYFKMNMSLLNYEIVPRLLHLDLHKNNIFIDQTSKKITGIFDVEESFIGHNEYCLSRIEDAHFKKDNTEKLKESFYQEYEKIIKLDPNFENRIHFYKLSRDLIHMNLLSTLKSEYSITYKQDVKDIIQMIENDNNYF